MKILRSKGQSFTVFEPDNRNAIARGLRRYGNDVLTPDNYRNSLDVDPSRLKDYVGEDYGLIIRQTISALDKVIRKPRTLKGFSIDGYVDRTHLAAALWEKLESQYAASIRSSENGQAAFKQFRRMWLSKVHAYAKHPFDEKNPRTDKNADVIKRYGDDKITRQDSWGRWHHAFWRQFPSGVPDYKATADAIWCHLFEREIKISGKDRGSRSGDGKPAPVGLISSRGSSMSRSVNDPRTALDLAARTKQATVQENAEIVETYFYKDVAKEIYDVVEGIFREDTELQASSFGAILYEHFGAILNDKTLNDDNRKDLWSLHNQVRKFYQMLGKSNRFRYALKDKDDKKLRQLVPADKESLLRVLGAKVRNAEFSSLIRLGKLLAHASDLTRDVTDEQTEFDRRLQFLVTSAGQSEIKRNEVFTRVWRASVALSLQTLRKWAPVSERKSARQAIDVDISSAKTAELAVRDYDKSKYENHLAIIFGDKAISHPENKSRKAIFFSDDEERNKEVLWALLRLAGEIRNRTNHFNTKQRLIELVDGGILKIDGKPPHFAQRKGNVVHEGALQTFERLLRFDIALQRQVIVDDFGRLQIHLYVSGERLSNLYAEMKSGADAVDLVVPKFMSVLRQAANLAAAEETAPDWVKRFGSLDLMNLSKATEGANHFKVGMLRALYSRGFVGWLDQRRDDSAFVRTAIQDVIDHKKRRVAGHNEQEGHYYALAQSAAEETQIGGVRSLSDLFSILLSRAMGDEGVHRGYRTNPDQQSERSAWIEAFKLELFALLFDRYLQQDTLSWLWEIRTSLDLDDLSEAPNMVTFDGPEWPGEIKLWHSQFYAWLYLVPIDDVALLRHQFRKTNILEKKGDGKVSQALIEIDRLMGLYLAVCSAGFSGREHVNELKAGELFYEDTSQFETVYSEAMETHHISLPGTRRGLRQILRMEHDGALKSIFEKHKVTAAEVEAFATLRAEEMSKVFDDKNKVAHEIVQLAKQKAPDLKVLEAKCEQYRELATRTALYNFKISGARLTEHARIHRLMMRVVSRLMDFTLMWERDREYVFLGLLYRKLEGDGPKIKIRRDASNVRIGLLLPDALKQKLKAEFAKVPKENRWRSLRNADLIEGEIGDGFLTIWDSEEGCVLRGDLMEPFLLEKNEQVRFRQYFGKLGTENSRDKQALAQRRAEGKEGRDPRRQAHSYLDGKWRIRNDFAHFNVIGKTRGVNLTYLTNAVRSLLSYDRKLKNVVSKAVAEILVDEGLIIEWQLEEDRLKRPTIIPKLETHLAFVRPSDQFAPRFVLPQASVRFTSMVKALFDFDSGGYRAQVESEGKIKGRGEMRYPRALGETLSKLGTTMPAEVLEFSYPSLLQDT
jgi:hypothetical protein